MPKAYKKITKRLEGIERELGDLESDLWRSTLSSDECEQIANSAEDVLRLALTIVSVASYRNGQGTVLEKQRRDY